MNRLCRSQIVVRSQIAHLHGMKDTAHATGDAAYRLLIPRKDMEKDAELSELVDSSIGLRWMGPGGHVMWVESSDDEGGQLSDD